MADHGHHDPGGHELEAVNRAEIVADDADKGDEQCPGPILAGDLPFAYDIKADGIADADKRVADHERVGRA